MVVRKKTFLDGTDKEILRNLRKIERGLSGRQIAKRVGLSDSSIKPRLDNLKKSGYVKDKCDGFRKYDREFNGKKKKITSCSRRTWTIDLD